MPGITRCFCWAHVRRYLIDAISKGKQDDYTNPAEATTSAIIYSIVEIAKAHDLNIYEYIKYTLSKRPSKSWTDEQFETIAPWNQDVIDSWKL